MHLYAPARAAALAAALVVGGRPIDCLAGSPLRAAPRDASARPGGAPTGKADAAARVHAALSERIASDGAFRARCEQAAARSLSLRRASRPSPGSEAELAAILQGPVVALEAELAWRLG